MTRLLLLALLLMLCTRNNTDGNKLVTFSGIASYYGDNYIIQYCDTQTVLLLTRAFASYKLNLPSCENGMELLEWEDVYTQGEPGIFSHVTMV